MPILTNQTAQTTPKWAQLRTALTMNNARAAGSPAPTGYYAQDDSESMDAFAPKWSRLQTALTMNGPRPTGSSSSMPRRSSSPMFASSSYTAPTSMQFSGLSSGMRGNIDNAAVNAKSAADSAYGAMIRNLSRMGVNANSPRFAGSMRKWAAGRAAMEAGARNTAEREGANAASSRNYNMSQAMLSANEAERSRQFSAAQAAMARDQDAAQAARAEAGRANDAQRQGRVALAEQRGYEAATKAAQKAAGAAPAPAAPSRMLPSNLDTNAVEADWQSRGLLPVIPDENPFPAHSKHNTFRRIPNSKWNR